MRGLATIPIRSCDPRRPREDRREAFKRPGGMDNRRQATPRRPVSMAARGIQPDPDLVEAIAVRVAELIGDGARSEASARLIDASALARELGVERDWVYSHAEDLGALRLGGPHGRLRFDREIVRERLGDGEPGRPRRQVPARPAGRGKSGGLPHGARLKSTDTQRRASGWTPARSPERQHPGGSPE